MMPGFSSGNQWKSTPGKSAALEPETTGEKNTRTIAGTSPPYTDQTAPRAVNRDQNRVYSRTGRLEEAATAKARPTRKATFSCWA